MLFEQISIDKLLNVGNNPFKRAAVDNRSIVASKLEADKYDESFTKTNPNGAITANGLKVTKMVNRGDIDADLFAGDDTIELTIPYYVSD